MFRRRSIRLARQDEASHFSVTGVPGAGKSLYIKQLMLWVRRCGYLAVVYDPHREFVPAFYRPGRDLLLNPLDARCPYWTPGDEITSEFETLTVAESLFPERRNEQPFFASATRLLMARLLQFRPTAHQLAAWMRDQSALDRLVLDRHGKPTNAAESISRAAPEMRSGVIAEMNRVANTLMMVPEEDRTIGRWSATAWAKERNAGGTPGWLFFTSTPETRAYTVPLTSLWLDLLVLRLMSTDATIPTVPVWFFFNEVATLQRLPQLQSAVSEGRKFNNPVVVDYQHIAQLKARYGEEWKVIGGMAKTQLIGRNQDPETARYLADALGGKEEVQRQTVSYTIGQRNSASSNLIREERDVVMPSQIMSLPDRHVYLKTVDSIVQLVLPIIELPAHCQGFVPRLEPEADEAAPVAPPPSVLVLNTPPTPAPRHEPAFIP